LGADVNISYDEWGAPKVDIPNIYISVSHSRDCVAVLFADRACAVDVESEERNFCGVANRYLSEEEQRIAEQHSLHAEMWCAKEALYKYHRRGGLDLVRDITIDSYDASRGVLVCTILGGAAIEVSVSRREGLVIAVID
jgi:phosphopantetheinyl transferase